ncbi:hypothetical protein [Sporisorium scitamineum]|uniref:Uncharacterized protein n=1 Tax=Sporisorium scitamineum TaxID=49012 RepID=A0A0F7S6T2_9BASI|nr:hypothetical protein [Sporisorium scitamineum]
MLKYGWNRTSSQGPQDQLNTSSCHPPPQPNTTIVEPLFDSTDHPACHGSMQASLTAWESMLLTYPNRNFISQLLGVIQHNTHLGYSGPLHNSSRYACVKNLPMDTTSISHI